MHACFPNCDATFLGKLTAAYVAFVTRIAAGYPPGSNLTFALVIGPHEAGQSAAILPAVATLAAAGVRAVFLNGTVPTAVEGCGGHPGPSTHAAAFQRLQPQVAALMGWY
jgi:hypothetical protein